MWIKDWMTQYVDGFFFSSWIVLSRTLGLCQDLHSWTFWVKYDISTFEQLECGFATELCKFKKKKVFIVTEEFNIYSLLQFPNCDPALIVLLVYSVLVLLCRSRKYTFNHHYCASVNKIKSSKASKKNGKFKLESIGKRRITPDKKFNCLFFIIFTFLEFSTLHRNLKILNVFTDQLLFYLKNSFKKSRI